MKLKKVRGSLFSDYLKRFLNNGTLTLADLRSKNPFNKKTEKTHEVFHCLLLYITADLIRRKNIEMDSVTRKVEHITLKGF